MSGNRLIGLPREVVRDLFELLTIPDICQLYCTGNRALRDVVESCPTGKLRFESSIQYTYGRLPKLATSSRGLKRLVISTSSRLADFPAESLRKIKLLPASLVALTLTTPEAELMLEETDVTELDALHKLFCTAFPHKDQSLRPRMLNLAKQFPALEKLVVIGDKGFFESFELFVLPPQLRTLSLPQSHKMNEELFEYLPSTLTALEIGYGVQFADYKFDASAKPLFPPHLEKFEWYRTHRHGKTKPKENWSVLEALPSSLTSFTYFSHNQIPHDLLSLLPKGLTMLNSNRDWDLASAPSLPNGLTSLHNVFCSTSPSSTLLRAILPSRLTSLHWELQGAYADLDWTALPRTLTELTMRAAGPFPGDQAPPLPPNLTSCIFRNTLYSTSGTTLEGRWPAGLTQLTVGISNKKGTPLTLPASLRELTISKLLPEDMKYLPSSLTSLHASYSIPSNFESLPPNLTCLHADEIDRFTTEMASQLPLTLTELYIPECTAPSLELKSAKWPLSLKALHLYWYRSNLSIEDLRNLPQGITALRLSAVMSGDLFGELPRTLKIFACGEVTARFGENLVNLPPFLHNFEASSGTFDSALLFHLPPTITRLVVPESIVRQFHFYLLPVGCTHTEMAYHHHDSEDFSMNQGPYNYTTRKLERPIPRRPPPTYTPKPLPIASPNATSPHSSTQEDSPPSRGCTIS